MAVSAIRSTKCPDQFLRCHDKLSRPQHREQWQTSLHHVVFCVFFFENSLNGLSLIKMLHYMYLTQGHFYKLAYIYIYTILYNIIIMLTKQALARRPAVSGREKGRREKA